MKFVKLFLFFFNLHSIASKFVTYQKVIFPATLHGGINKSYDLNPQTLTGCASICSSQRDFPCHFFFQDKQTAKCFLGNTYNFGDQVLQDFSPPGFAMVNDG